MFVTYQMVHGNAIWIRSGSNSDYWKPNLLNAPIFGNRIQTWREQVFLGTYVTSSAPIWRCRVSWQKAIRAWWPVGHCSFKSVFSSFTTQIEPLLECPWSRYKISWLFCRVECVVFSQNNIFGSVVRNTVHQSRHFAPFTFCSLPERLCFWFRKLCCRAWCERTQIPNYLKIGRA